MTGLQDAVQEYLKAPPANTLPQPLFTSTLSIHLEEGLRQTLKTALSDQDSQGSRKNAWRNLKLGGIATPKQWEREEDEMVTSCSIIQSSLIYRIINRTHWLEGI